MQDWYRKARPREHCQAIVRQIRLWQQQSCEMSQGLGGCCVFGNVCQTSRSWLFTSSKLRKKLRTDGSPLAPTATSALTERSSNLTSTLARSISALHSGLGLSYTCRQHVCRPKTVKQGNIVPPLHAVLKLPKELGSICIFTLQTISTFVEGRRCRNSL